MKPTPVLTLSLPTLHSHRRRRLLEARSSDVTENESLGPRRRSLATLGVILAVAFLGAGSPLGAQAVIDGAATTSPGGIDLRISAATSTLVGDTDINNREAFLALNDNNAIIASPGDGGFLWIMDTDDGDIYYKIYNDTIQFADVGSGVGRAIFNGNDSQLLLVTGGASIDFYTDFENDTGQTNIMRVFINGTSLSNRRLELSASGDLQIDGSLTQNFGFDLAEAFLASEPLQPGELVAVDPQRPDAVRGAGPGDRAVLGVVSGRPGVVLGGGVFSVERLEKNWGREVADRFRAEQAVLAVEALALREDLQELSERASSFHGFVAARGAPAAASIKPEDMELLRAELAAEQERLEQELAGAALDLFFQRNFVSVALAGRVPVKVDAVHGVIAPGDPLAPGPRPRTAAKAVGAGPVVGIALEAHDGGAGEILMLVQRGWHGHRNAPRPMAAASELESPRSTNAALERRVAELEAAMVRLAGNGRPRPPSANDALSAGGSNRLRADG